MTGGAVINLIRSRSDIYQKSKIKKRPAYFGKREEKDWDCMKKPYGVFPRVNPYFCEQQYSPRRRVDHTIGVAAGGKNQKMNRYQQKSTVHLSITSGTILLSKNTGRHRGFPLHPKARIPYFRLGNTNSE